MPKVDLELKTKRNYKKRTTKFNNLEVDPLLVVAQGHDKELITDPAFDWIKKLDQVDARNILIERFASLISTLIDVTRTGRYFTSYTRTFLKLFGATGIDLSPTARRLKNQLSVYSKEEIWHTGQVAILLAIEKTTSNLSSAIVYTFKELIQKMIDDLNKSQPGLEIVENFSVVPNLDSLGLSLFLDTLNSEEYNVCVAIIDGEPGIKHVIPESLKIKFGEYLKPLY